MIVRTFILAISLLMLTACATASDKLNDKLAGQTADQRLVTLQTECSATAEYYKGTRLKDGQPPKYLLTKLCAYMGAQIKRAHKSSTSKNVDAFGQSYERCVDESKSLGSTFVYRGSRSSQHHGLAYYYQARAICDAYKKIAEEFHAARSPSASPGK